MTPPIPTSHIPDSPAVRDSAQWSQSDVLIVGAGPAGLAAAIRLKSLDPDRGVLVLEKAGAIGEHNLSGAVLETDSLEKLLDGTTLPWREDKDIHAILSRRVTRDDTLFFPNRARAIRMNAFIHAAHRLRLGPGKMRHTGDAIISISRLTRWLGGVAERMGVEILCGFSAKEPVWDDHSRVIGVRLVEQGLDRHKNQQPNYTPAEIITADVVVLAEGGSGYVTEQFVTRAGLTRQAHPLYSLGVKEVIRVSDEQYAAFRDDRVVHAMGWPLWTPVIGPTLFGGGILYSVGENRIAAGVIVGLDWEYSDLCPQDALSRFKEHRFVNRFIAGGDVIESGAKLIPEGGYFTIPRDPLTRSIGKENVVILGDGAGFVNMQKIKGLHNAILSGMIAAEAIVKSEKDPSHTAETYTELIDRSSVGREMYQARNFRQTVARFGSTIGFPLSIFSSLLPKWRIERDRDRMKKRTYRYKPERDFDKNAFIAAARVAHREDQPSHCEIVDPDVCANRCANAFGQPCITFCPAGVYENVLGELLAAYPSNCLHCKTCENKCPFDNIRWHVPEGGGGPRYRDV